MKKYFLIILILFAFIRCQSSDKSRTGIFLGGQIVNPSSRTVALYQGVNAIEALELDKNLRFERKFDSLPSGIYKLEHLPEYQTLLLEERDSLLVRINAAVFDESIVYSGIGASKNNFLVELFLKQKSENVFLSSKYSSNKNSFKKIVDSLLIEKKQLWIEMDSLNNLSPVAQKVTQAAYIYPYANIKERYALLRGSKWTVKEDSLFFNYRQFLDFDDNDLAFFDPYINYVINYISQRALNPGESYFKAKETTDFNIRRLEVLDKEIGGSLLRNNIARAITFEEILRFENHDEHERFLQYYATVNNSPSHLSEVLNLHKDINKMDYGKPLPKILLQNTSRDTISSASIPNGYPSVIYFWSQTQMNQYKNTLERVEFLKEKYNNIRFIGICIQPFNSLVDQIQKMMEIETKDQFALINFEKASKAWVLTILNKSIILNGRGDIIDGFGNFSGDDLEMILEEL